MRRWPWQKSSEPGKRRRIWLWIVAGLVLWVVIGVLVAEPVIERIVESGIETMPGGYHGSIEAVDVRPLSAEIALIGLKIEKQNGKVPVPYLDVGEFVIATVRQSWRLRTNLRIVEPIVNLVDAPNKAAAQWGPKFDLKELRAKLPFELNRVDIERAQVHFRNFHAKPEVDVYLADAHVTWDKLIGCLPDGSQACDSVVSARSKFMKSGHAKLEGTFARSPNPETRVRLDIDELNARELNAVLSEYAKVDVQAGEVDATMRYSGRNKAHSFRIVPRLTDIKVVGGDDKDTRFFREVGLAAAAGWFERKKGTKAIAIESKPSGKFDFSLVDLPKESADGKGG